MATFVVAYDLNHEVRRPNIVEEIKRSGSWARLSESSYAIETSEKPSQVMARLRKFLDDNDNLYVVTLNRPWSGWGPKDVIDWLVKRLGSGE